MRQFPWPSRLMLLVVFMVAFRSIECARVKAADHKPYRMLFTGDGPDDLMNMVGGLFESQHNFQSGMAKGNDPIAEILSGLTAPLLAAQRGFADVQSFLADPLNLQNSPLAKELSESLEPNEEFFKNFQSIVSSGNPADSFFKSAETTWDPAINEFIHKDTTHADMSELASALGLREFFEADPKDVTSMSIVNVNSPVHDKKVNEVFDKLDEWQKKKYYNFNFTETYVPSDKVKKVVNKTTQIVDKIAKKINKPKSLPPLKEKKPNKLEDKWTKFWAKQKWTDLKNKVENVTMKGSALKPSQKKPITLDGKLGEKLVYKDNQVLAWEKKLKPPASPDYLKPLVDVVTDDTVGRWLSPMFAKLPRFRDPIFKNPATWATPTFKQIAGVNARMINYAPCFVSDSITGVSVQPVMFNLSPRLISVSAEGVNIAPTLINTSPTLINIAPKGLESSPKMIDINPRLIGVTPNVAWTGVPVPTVLGKPDRKRPSDPPPGTPGAEKGPKGPP